MDAREQRIWQSVLDALDSRPVQTTESKIWVIMVVGTTDYTWYHTVVELPNYTPYTTLEDTAAKIVRLKLQESNIHPSFVKMKSLTHDEAQVRSILRAG